MYRLQEIVDRNPQFEDDRCAARRDAQRIYALSALIIFALFDMAKLANMLING